MASRGVFDFGQIGRKALFAGKDYIAMVKLIVNVLGNDARPQYSATVSHRTESLWETTARWARSCHSSKGEPPHAEPAPSPAYSESTAFLSFETPLHSESALLRRFEMQCISVPFREPNRARDALLFRKGKEVSAHVARKAAHELPRTSACSFHCMPRGRQV